MGLHKTASTRHCVRYRQYHRAGSGSRHQTDSAPGAVTDPFPMRKLLPFLLAEAVCPQCTKPTSILAWSLVYVVGHTARASAVTTKDIAVSFKPALAAEGAGPAEQQTSVREFLHSN